MVSQLINGFFFPFRGFRFLLYHRGLLWYIVIPCGINAMLFGVFAWFVASYFRDWLDRFLPSGDAWYWTFLFYILIGLLAIVMFLVVVYSFTLVGNIILGPFNDLLSEKVELVYTGKVLNGTFRLKAFLADIVRSIKVELGKLVLYLGGLLSLLVLNLLPIIGNVLYVTLVMVYTLFFLGWEYFDYSMERGKFTFRRKIKTVFGNTSVFIGFGAGASLMLLIPLANLATIPLCVVGATLLFCDLRKEGKLTDKI